MPPSDQDEPGQAPVEETSQQDDEEALLSLGASPSRSPRSHASKIKGKLSRLHRRAPSTEGDEGEEAPPQIFHAPRDAREAATSPGSRKSSSFQRAAEPEDDFIVTTHPFEPSSDRSLHGLAPFDSALPWKTPERIVGLERREQVERHRIAFFDIETSGLRNTDPIICAALGFWLEHHPASMFHVKHYFIFHPRAEANMLRAMLTDLCAFDVLCTYNGKSFDVPRIKSRCNHLGLDPIGITRQRHADLVHTARRVLPKRNHKLNLAMMEQTLLDFSRAHDLPGSEVPRRWHQFTASQDLSLLDEIRDHNLLDVVSLAALLEIFAQGGPGRGAGAHHSLLQAEASNRGQQALPLAPSAASPRQKARAQAPSRSGEREARIVQPPSQGEALSPLQRKLARSYQLKSKSGEAPPGVSPASPATRRTPAPPVSREVRASEDPAWPAREGEDEEQEVPSGVEAGGAPIEAHDPRPGAGQQVGPRVAQLRAIISARVKQDASALSRECMPLVMELVALDPHHTQGLRWMITCYEQLGATSLARTIRARYDAQDPYS